MSIHLFENRVSESATSQLRLLAAYESGTVTLFHYEQTEQNTSIEGIGWECVWSTKQHVESGKLFASFSDCVFDVETKSAEVMAMAVSRDCTLALTASADHLIVRYDLQVCRYLSSGNSYISSNKSAASGAYEFRWSKGQ